MRISDGSSDVCSSDLLAGRRASLDAYDHILRKSEAGRLLIPIGHESQFTKVQAAGNVPFCPSATIPKQRSKLWHPSNNHDLTGKNHETLGRTGGYRPRTEERRVGKERFRTFRSRWAP